MQIECVVFIIGVLIQITTFHSWVQFALGRLVSGLGVGALSAAVPMYQAEAGPPQIRGMLTATYQLFITFGILVAYAISIGTRAIGGSGAWRTVVGIGIAWPLVLMVGMQFMPESPRWLTRQGREEDAKISLARVRGVPVEHALDHWIISREIEEIKSNWEYEKQVQGGWLDCFRPGNKILYRTFLGTCAFPRMRSCD
jgi:MFS transporter, SP family, sugar:H+ symporter